MPFYPNASFILPTTTFRRDRRLPANVAGREVTVAPGQSVDADRVVLLGARAGGYRIVPLFEPLGVKRAEDFDPNWLRVAEDMAVRAGQPLAERGKGRRARKVLAPVNCLVARIEPDRLVLQANPEDVEVRATLPGVVTNVTGKISVQIESTGVLIQGAWGNGKSGYGLSSEEPEDGLQSLATETLMATFRTQILLIKRPLTRELLDIALQQEVAGLIAPSMPSDLQAAVRACAIPIVLTEGFGNQQMSQIVYNLLRSVLQRQTALDAIEPSRWSAERPEIFISLAAGRGSPAPVSNQPLEVGTQVRLARAPFAGQTGTVKRVIETPRALENGLRLAGAEIQLSQGGSPVFVPIANIELLGRAPNAKN